METNDADSVGEDMDIEDDENGRGFADVIVEVVEKELTKMTESEQEEILSGDSIVVTVETLVSSDEDDEVAGRSFVSGTTSIVDPELSRMKRKGSLEVYLEQCCACAEMTAEEYLLSITGSETPEDSSIDTSKTFFVSDAMLFLAKSGRYDDIAVLATERDIAIDIDRISDDMAYINSEPEYDIKRGSFDEKNLPNGSVLVSKSGRGSNLVTIIEWFDNLSGGYYNHAGFFDKSLYKKISSKCMRSADDDGTKTQSLSTFLSKSRFAAVYPIKWSASGARKAAGYASSIFKFDKDGDDGDGKVRYFKWHEFLSDYNAISNYSHNGKGDRVICTKVPYAMWKKAGIGLDSGNVTDSPFAECGKVITPDELRFSAKDGYKKIEVFGVTLYKKKVYSKQSKLYYKQG